MDRFCSRLLACCAAWLLATSPAHAGDEEVNLRLNSNVSFDLAESVAANVQMQTRITDNSSRLGQIVLRSSLTYRVSDSVRIGAGYAYFFTDVEDGANRGEHRFMQDVTVRLFANDSISIRHRNRLEQRIFTDSSGTGWRYRSRIWLRAKLNPRNDLILSTEPFIGLNEAGRNRSGLSGWRNEIGVSLPLGEVFTLTPSYINQRSIRPGNDSVQHIANLRIRARL